MRSFKFSFLTTSIFFALSGITFATSNSIDITNNNGTVGGGDPNKVVGKNSLAIGNGNNISGDKITINGYKNTSTVDSSSVYGDENTISKLTETELNKKRSDLGELTRLSRLQRDLNNLKVKKYYSTLDGTIAGYIKEYNEPVSEWEDEPIDISNGFLTDSSDYDNWARNHSTFISSLQEIHQLSLQAYKTAPNQEMIRKILFERRIPTEDLINTINQSGVINKTQEYLTNHINYNQFSYTYFNANGDKVHNLLDVRHYLDLDDLVGKSGQSTVYFLRGYLNTHEGTVTKFNPTFDYSAILNSLSSDNVVNTITDYGRMKYLLSQVDWDPTHNIYNKETLDGLKNRLEKNTKLYEILASIGELQLAKKNGVSQQDKIDSLIKQAKEIIQDKNNLFTSDFKYLFNKENYLKEVNRLKKDHGENNDYSYVRSTADLAYISKQLDEGLEDKYIEDNPTLRNKQKELDNQKRSDLLSIKDQQLQLINGLDAGDVSSYKSAIENYSLTEDQINELNKKIAESTKGGIANTVVGYKNFNGGSRTHIVGAENIVLSQESGVIGNNNNLSREATNTFVLGSNVTTNIPNSVALGKDTTLSAPIATPSHTIAGTQYNFAGIAPTGTVSIGAEGKERTLTNLAAGRISNTSTDGINGSQLNAVIETLNSLNTELTTLKNAPKGGKTVIKAGDGLNLTEGDDGSITLSNALTFNSGNGMSVNKEGNNITITNTKPFEEGDKEKLNTTSTNANSALEKANTNEGAINTANGKIAINEGKITTQEGEINDLTSRVTANEGNITTLTGKVTTVNNTANEALGKANTNAETINDVSGVANDALGKANTAVQPDKLKAGDGISVNQAENGEITITNTRESGNGLADLTIEGKDNITVNKDGNKYVIGSKALPSTGNTSPKLAVAGDKNIDATIDNNNVSLKLKDNLDVQNVQARTINSKNVVADNLNTNNLNAKNVNAEKLIIGGNELGTKGLTVGDININENGIDAGNKPINNVADGEISPNSQQAINGRQLYPIVNQLDIQRQHIQNLDDRVGRVEQGLHKQNTLRKAGNASAMATAGLLQPHKSGQSGITAAVGQYQGQTAVAVGYSALSDNGKYGVKFSINTNTQKEMGGSAGVGYFW